MDEQIDAGQLTGSGDCSGAAEVSATRARLPEAHAAGGELSAQLARAAAAATGTARTDPT